MELAIPFEANCGCGWSSVYADETKARHMAQNHQSYRNMNDSHTGFKHEANVQPIPRKIKFCSCGEFFVMVGCDVCSDCYAKRQDEFSTEINAYYGQGRNI